MAERYLLVSAPYPWTAIAEKVVATVFWSLIAGWFVSKVLILDSKMVWRMISRM
jgi:hypothetical protein